MRKLKKSGWNSINQKVLQELIWKHGKESKTYRPDKKPYIVMDWDNTSVLYDVEEASYVYQVEKLAYKIGPEEFFRIIKLHLGEDDTGEESYYALIERAKYLYKKLYDRCLNYQDLKEDKDYKEFTLVMKLLYHDISAKLPYRNHCLWVINLFANMTKKEVQDLAVLAFRESASKPPRIEHYKLKLSFNNKEYLFETNYKLGMRPLREMQDLYANCMESGIDVYICSASFKDVVQACASLPEFDYNIPEENIYALELQRDLDGRYLTKIPKDFTLTLQEGKAKTIEDELVKVKGYPPILVGGDSMGDYEMLVEYPEAIKLIINCNDSKKLEKMKAKAVEEGKIYLAGGKMPTHLIQNRNDKEGKFKEEITDMG